MAVHVETRAGDTGQIEQGRQQIYGLRQLSGTTTAPHPRGCDHQRDVAQLLVERPDPVVVVVDVRLARAVVLPQVHAVVAGRR